MLVNARQGVLSSGFDVNDDFMRSLRLRRWVLGRRVLLDHAVEGVIVYEDGLRSRDGKEAVLGDCLMSRGTSSLESEKRPEMLMVVMSV